MDFKIVSSGRAPWTEADVQRQAFKRDVPDFFETLLASSFREFVRDATLGGTGLIVERGHDRGYQHHHLTCEFGATIA